MINFTSRSTLERRLAAAMRDKDALALKMKAQSAQLAQQSLVLTRKRATVAHLNGQVRALAQARRDLRAHNRKLQRENDAMREQLFGLDVESIDE